MFQKIRIYSALLAMIQQLFYKNKKISIIKEVRELTSLGLKDAKDWVDQYIYGWVYNNNAQSLVPAEGPLTTPVWSNIFQVVPDIEWIHEQDAKLIELRAQAKYSPDEFEGLRDEKTLARNEANKTLSLLDAANVEIRNLEDCIEQREDYCKELEAKCKMLKKMLTAALDSCEMD